MQLKTPSFSKFFLLLLVLFSLSKTSVSQTNGNGKIVAFHPSVGNAIDLSEKKEFGIFTEYNDSLFESAQLVKYSSDNYSVLIKTKSGQSFEKPMTIPELDAIYASIEKVKPISASSTEDDYVVEQRTPEKPLKKKDRSETAYIIGEVTLQVLFVFLEILAQVY